MVPFVMKGYLVDWDAQKAIWDGIFSDQVLNVSTRVTYHPVLTPSHPRRLTRRRHRFLLLSRTSTFQIYKKFMTSSYSRSTSSSHTFVPRVRHYHCRGSRVDLHSTHHSRSSRPTRRTILTSGAATTRMHACGGRWLQFHPYSANHGGCCSLVGCEKVCGFPRDGCAPLLVKCWQGRCWWEAPNKPSQRASLISSMEHDGRNTYHE